MLIPNNGSGLSKQERLYLRRHIELLVLEGKVVYTGELLRVRAIWIAHRHSSALQAEPPPACPQILISVSKRSYKRAHQRNLAKRRIREAYRLNKQLLQPIADKPGYFLALHVVWIGKTPKRTAGDAPLVVPPYAQIHTELVEALGKLCKRAEGLPTGEPAYKARKEPPAQCS